MKKFSILLFVILMITSLSLKSACPPGYTEHIITGTYSYSSGSFVCHFTIAFCCKYDNNLKQVVAEIQYYYSTYNHCIMAIPDEQDFSDWLHATVAHAASVFCGPLYPPCDDTTHIYYESRIYASHCWYYENYQPYLDDYVLRRVKCDDEVNYCLSVWRVCTDYSTTPPIIKEFFISKQPYGQPDCPTTVPELPEEGDPKWGEHWITTCFARPC